MSEQLTLDRDAVEPDGFPNVDDEIISTTSVAGTSWRKQASRQLAAIEQLPPGWDSHGGDSPNSSIVHSACGFLQLLLRADATLPKPHIHPTPSGGVQFHWEYHQRYFEIEFVDERSAQFYFVDRADKTEIEGDVHLGDSLSDVVELIHTVGTEP